MEPITDGKIRAIAKEEAEAIVTPVREMAKTAYYYLFGDPKNKDSMGLDEDVRNIKKQLSLLIKLAWAVTISAVSFFGLKIAEIIYSWL